MSIGKAFAVYVCWGNIYCSTHIDINSHVLACDNFELKLPSCIVCYETPYVSKKRAVSWTRSGVAKTVNAVQNCRVTRRGTVFL